MPPIMFLMFIIFMSIGTGAGILVAQLFGARDMKGLERCIGTSVTLTFLSSVLVTALGFRFAGPVLGWIETPDAYYDIAKSYLQIIALGVIGTGFYNIIGGILRGLGDSFFPLVFLVTAAAINIALDLWFVIGFGWGVAGAAWATLIAQGISGILCVIRLMHMKDIIVVNKKSLSLHMDTAKKMLQLGLPAGATQGIFSLAMLFVQALTNRMGTFIPAISIAVMRVDGFAMLPNFTFGLAISTYIGQNLGAGRTDRIKPGEKAVLKLALGCATALVIALFIWGKGLIGLFINQDNTDPKVYQQVLDLGGMALRILAVGYLAMAITQIYGGILRAAGDTMSPMFISIITTVAMRVPIAYILAYFTISDEWPEGHPYALFISLLALWILGALLTYLRFRQGKWKNIKLVD